MIGKNKAIKIIGFYIAVGLLTFLLFDLSIHLEEKRDEKILDDYSRVVGQVEYVISGNEAFSMSLKYRYKANDSIHYRIVEVGREYRDYYSEFVSNPTKTEDLRVWVIYSNKDNSASLADISNPFYQTKREGFPNNLSHFK